MIAKSHRTPGSILLDAGLACALLVALGAVFATDIATKKTEPTTPPVMPVKEELEESAPPPPPPPPPLLVAESVPEVPPPPPAPVAEVVSEPPPPPEKPKPIDRTRLLTLGCIGWGSRFGVTTKSDKKLTFSLFGHTNNTRVRIDNLDQIVGSPAGLVSNSWQTKGEGAQITESKKDGTQSSVTPGKLVPDGPYSYVWKLDDVEVAQVVDYVFGASSQKMDTILVNYTLTNLGRRTRTVALRALLDTYIGQNDGVPFYVPGQNGIIDKTLIVKGDKVPETILALEKPTLADPGTVVQLTFGAENSERPTKLVLSRFPYHKVGPTMEPDPDALWDWNPRPNAPFDNDSAVGFYYESLPLKAGERRTFSYTYGLGSLSSTQTRNAALSLTTGGSLEVGRAFRLIALINPAKRGQKVEIILPDGLKLPRGEDASKSLSVAAGGGPSQESWLVSIDPDASGTPAVKVRLTPEGIEESLAIQVQNPQQSLQLTSSGTPQAGTAIWIAANVQHAKPGQQVTLNLPSGCRLDARSEATQAVPATSPAQIKWLVVLEATASGSISFKAATKPDGVEGSLAVMVQRPRPSLRLVAPRSSQAGGKMWIAANLQNAAPGQAVTLTLPAGCRLETGYEATQSAPANISAQIKWLVSLDPSLLGPISFKARTTLDPISDAAQVEVKAFKPQVTLSIPGDREPEAGKKFWVTVQVTPKTLGMTAELSLPSGLTFSGDRGASQSLKDEPGFGWATWLVQALPSAAGPQELRVSVSGGETKSKTIEVRPASIVR